MDGREFLCCTRIISHGSVNHDHHIANGGIVTCFLELLEWYTTIYCSGERNVVLFSLLCEEIEHISDSMITDGTCTST